MREVTLNSRTETALIVGAAAWEAETRRKIISKPCIIDSGENCVSRAPRPHINPWCSRSPGLWTSSHRVSRASLAQDPCTPCNFRFRLSREEKLLQGIQGQPHIRYAVSPSFIHLSKKLMKAREKAFSQNAQNPHLRPPLK
ncbi:uncharacterized protein BDCG_16876 [Blastomyces dermatitidis ER-3]|uniref:Uncharacterized protein n=2 Tax=Blastomyces TaxID=229219 RepID=A0A179UC98_BLAGS|nr:uncharacterized protein BDBG_16305 [Blastomyces gilchristii SLH14081]XP_045280778.1 uncharacterized protein BDCG_16876 [Blastomyces dermatitidis ER-3]OAT01051.1 hypothetical protein BDCG_16876 [Blastomyces dermatitidis ER-3]OAT04651.1 hypothetical protein BDBG_16305 [Blastomyces gilchristii SLH14081]